MAVITGLLAQIKFYIPWSPVPITGQTFAVLLAGIMLGKNWGGISQVIYVALGATGLGWFAGGYNALVGPSGGYIIGFVLAALFIGYVFDTYAISKNFMPMIILMTFANFILIYGFGMLQLGLWMYIVKGSAISIRELLLLGAVPFVIGDIVKIFGVALIAKAIYPKED